MSDFTSKPARPLREDLSGCPVLPKKPKLVPQPKLSSQPARPLREDLSGCPVLPKKPQSKFVPKAGPPKLIRIVPSKASPPKDPMPQIVRVNLREPNFDVYVCGKYVPKDKKPEDLDPRISMAESYPFQNRFFDEPEAQGAPKYEAHLRKTQWKKAISDLALKLNPEKPLILGCWCDPAKPDPRNRWCHAKIVSRLIYERHMHYKGLEEKAARLKAAYLQESLERKYRPQLVLGPELTQLGFDLGFASCKQALVKELGSLSKDSDQYFSELSRVCMAFLEGHPEYSRFLFGDPGRFLLSEFYSGTELFWLGFPCISEELSRMGQTPRLSKMTFASGPSRPDSEDKTKRFELVPLDRTLRGPPLRITWSYETQRMAFSRAKSLGFGQDCLELEDSASEDFVLSLSDEHDQYVQEGSAEPCHEDFPCFMAFLKDMDSRFSECSRLEGLEYRSCLFDGHGLRLYSNVALGFEGSCQTLVEGQLADLWFDLTLLFKEDQVCSFLKVIKLEELDSTWPKAQGLTLPLCLQARTGQN